MKKISLHILLFLSVIFLFSGLKVAKAEEERVSRLSDEAAVLTVDEAKRILEKMDAFSEKYQMDLVIRTMRNGDYTDILLDTEDYFIENQFGFVEIHGDKGAGMILAMDFERRDWALESFGKMEEIAPKTVRDEMADYFLPYLSNNEYFKGFDTFLDLVGETVSAYESGEKVSYEAKADLPEASHSVNETKIEDNTVMKLVISAVIALIIALVTVIVLTSQLSNVRPATHAAAYEVEGSFRLRDRSDYFLYRTVNKTKKAKSSSSGSSGGSSGGSSTGSSGKF